MKAGDRNPGTREEALAYIFEMSTALKDIAQAYKMPFLAYLLEMVALATVSTRRERQPETQEPQSDT